MENEIATNMYKTTIIKESKSLYFAGIYIYFLL